jgi:Flp pilus assembly protein TadD
VSKLRRALDDNVQGPAYIETIPKRGYRLIAEVSSAASTIESGQGRQLSWIAAVLAVLVALLAVSFVVDRRSSDTGQSDTELLVSRADDFYMRFTQADNAAAIDLYERAIAREPEHGRAHAGLANALVQRVIRWPGDGTGVSSLSDALAGGLNETPQARELLSRATSLAERAVRLAPDDSAALKARGLVLATSGRLDEARKDYERAIALDGDAWEPLINLGELAQLEDDLPAAIEFYTRAYEVMQRLYDREPQRIGPWHAPLGVVIGKLHENAGDLQGAEAWYRRILRLSPYDPQATARLALILAAAGDLREAQSLCRNLIAAGSRHAACDEMLARSAVGP